MASIDREGKRTPGVITKTGIARGNGGSSIDPTTHGGPEGNGRPVDKEGKRTPGVETRGDFVNAELIDGSALVHPDSVHHHSRPKTAAYDVGGRHGKPLNLEQTRGSKNIGKGNG